MTSDQTNILSAPAKFAMRVMSHNPKPQTKEMLMSTSKFIPFFTACNLVGEDIQESSPWDFRPGPDAVEQMRLLSKEERVELVSKPQATWNVYSPFRGCNQSLPVSHDNPAAAMRGVVAEYGSVFRHELKI